MRNEKRDNKNSSKGGSEGMQLGKWKLQMNIPKERSGKWKKWEEGETEIDR